MTFKIEKNVPIPKLARGRVAATQFPLAEMGPGDSFLVPCDPKDKKVLDSWRRKVLMAKKKLGEGDFRTVAVADGLRVFCTA
jgi:hypothetical protein